MENLTLIGIPVENLNKSKYFRQLREVVTWKGEYKARATITACTGFGKSIIAVIAIKKMLKKNPYRNTLIVVPTTPLKKQWEGHIKNFNLKNVEVKTIQSLVKLDKVIYDLLIIDEIHLFASDVFSNIFKIVKYHWILGLTGTFDRLDNKHNLLKKYAPVSGGVNIKEAVEKLWVSDFIEINVPIYMTQSESSTLQNINKKVNFAMSKFGDFDKMRKCINEGAARSLARQKYPENIDEMTKIIIGWSVTGQRYVKMRQDFLYNLKHKVDFVDKASKFNLKTIVFSQSIKFIDSVKEKLSDCLIYHSNVTSEKVTIKIKKEFKTIKPAQTFASKVKSEVVKDKEVFSVTYNKEVTTNKEKVLEKTLSDFKTKLFGNLVTAKALDTGYDDDSIEIGLDCARTSSPTQHSQRRGRIIRDYTYSNGTRKLPIYINLFVPNSVEEKWLTKAQSSYTDKIIELSVSETLNILEKHAKFLGRVE